MKVAILGDGLISLTLAKSLANEGIYVDIFSNQKNKKISSTRTISISKSNIEFFNKNILKIGKLLWNINQIEIYSDSTGKEKILNFENKGQKLFSILKNHELYKLLLKNLKKNSSIKFKNKIFDKDLTANQYKLVFNCDSDNSITKKFFYQNLKKNYFSNAYTTIIEHEKLNDNHTAIQIFTNQGPLAFLPISKTKTSIVFSIKGTKVNQLDYLIKKYNTKYKIIKIQKPLSFELKSSISRKYTHKNILAFGDLLHRLHPLAGQGFNMSIRDIKEILFIIRSRMSIGLDLDRSIFLEFEKNFKHKNFLFSNGIDFIYEFFNFDNKLNNGFLSKSVRLLGKNKLSNNFFKKFADDGIVY